MRPCLSANKKVALQYKHHVSNIENREVQLTMASILLEGEGESDDRVGQAGPASQASSVEVAPILPLTSCVPCPGAGDNSGATAASDSCFPSEHDQVWYFLRSATILKLRNYCKEYNFV